MIIIKAKVNCSFPSDASRILVFVFSNRGRPHCVPKANEVNELKKRDDDGGDDDIVATDHQRQR